MACGRAFFRRLSTNAFQTHYARRARVAGADWVPVDLPQTADKITDLVRAVCKPASSADRARVLRVRPTGLIPTAAEEAEAVQLPLLSPLPKEPAYFLVEQPNADRLFVSLRALPDDPDPVEQAPFARLTAAKLAETLRYYGAVGLAEAPGGPLLDGMDGLCDRGVYYVVRCNSRSAEARLGKLERCNQNKATAMENSAAQRVTRWLRETGCGGVTVVFERQHVGSNNMEIDGTVLLTHGIRPCAVLLEVGAVLNEATAKRLRDRLQAARRNRNPPPLLAGRALAGVLAGGVVKPIVKGYSASELCDEWAMAGYGLMLPNGDDFSFGDECFKSAQLRWETPPCVNGS